DPHDLIHPWVGPNGERGFTHASPGAFSFATNAIGDPQFKSDGAQALLVDLWADSLPASLEVIVATRFFEPGQATFKHRPKPADAASGWARVRLEPSDFQDDKGTALATWNDVNFLCFSGTAEGDRRTVFKNLRWEKIDSGRQKDEG